MDSKGLMLSGNGKGQRPRYLLYDSVDVTLSNWQNENNEQSAVRALRVETNCNFQSDGRVLYPACDGCYTHVYVW